MRTRSLSRPLAWMIVLALVLPLAGLAESCDECLEGGLPGCCPPACSLCLCCGQGRTVLAGAPRVDPDLGLPSAFSATAAGKALSADPRDVFHVPKTFLI